MFLPSKLDASSSVNAGIVILLALDLSLFIRRDEADWNSSRLVPIFAVLRCVNHAKQEVMASTKTQKIITYDFASLFLLLQKRFIFIAVALKKNLLFVTLHLHPMQIYFLVYSLYLILIVNHFKIERHFEFSAYKSQSCLGVFALHPKIYADVTVVIFIGRVMI